MTLYRARVFDTPDDPFAGASLRADSDAGLLVADGVITARGDFVSLRSSHPEEDVVDLREGVLLPGLVDTHVHYPQVRVIGALGMPLLEWLDTCALPEEAKSAAVKDLVRTCFPFKNTVAEKLGFSSLVIFRKSVSP